MKKILSVATTAQNLLKIASLDKAFRRHTTKTKHHICQITHSHHEPIPGHFEGIDLPKVSFRISLDASGKVLSTAQTMIEFEKVLSELKPSLVILTGSHDTTLACALAASKRKIPLAHTDSGLRSFDRESNEEVNRILIDVLCQHLFVSEHSGMKNLRDEGEDNQNICFAGNLLSDILNQYWDSIENRKPENISGLQSKEKYMLYVPATDIIDYDAEETTGVFDMLSRLTNIAPVFAVISNKTMQELETKRIIKPRHKKIKFIPPVNYLDFLSLMKHSSAVITNSVSIQEETTYLGVQCVTIMNYTERPVTIDVGTNHLAGKDPEKAEKAILDIFDGTEKPGRLPENWDGKVGKRVVEVLANL